MLESLDIAAQNHDILAKSIANNYLDEGLGQQRGDQVVSEMSEGVFEVLRHAVNLARFEGIRRLDALKRRLMALYPDREEDIKAALLAWSQYVRAR